MTIIILIILSGVTIDVVLGKNGLFKKAEQTKEYMENAIVSDETVINKILAEMNGIIGSEELEEIGEITREEMFEKTTEIKDDEGNSVWIPKDFGIDEDSATNQDEGIVITDEIGNEFVWVPVPDPSTMFETVEEPVTLSDGVATTIKYSKLRQNDKYIGDIPGENGEFSDVIFKEPSGYDSEYESSSERLAMYPLYQGDYTTRVTLIIK